MLTVDYIVNATPIIGRHIFVLGTISMFYLFVNFSATKLEGKPVYPPMTWDSVPSTLFAFALWFFGILVFAALFTVNKAKLKFYSSINIKDV